MVFLRTLEAKHMTRLTVTLDDELHQALKETAARQGRTIGSIVEESLRMRGIRTVASARDLVAKARTRSRLDENQALSVALEETRRLRGK
jgi:hypothetical protein